ncbi:MAG: ABC transporter permease [Chloroflexota bacterium]|nr:ABC transporter permease [Chloroflexota bacterium]
MIPLLSFEFVKVLRRGMPRAAVLGSCGLVVAAFLLLGPNETERGNLLLPRALLAALSFSSFLAPFFWPVVGASWAGNEYDWGTIRAILTRRPDRAGHVLAALTILLASVGLGMLAILIAGVVGGIATAVFQGGELLAADILSSTFFGTLVEGLLAAWYLSAFYLLVAYAAATVARSAAIGVGFALGATLAQYLLRSILLGLSAPWSEIAARFPIVYANSLITRVVGGQLLPGTSLATARAYEPTVSESLLALALYGALCLAVTLIAVRTRDVTA